MTYKVLSTKILDLESKKELNLSSYQYSEKNFIKIIPNDYYLNEIVCDSLIFTSQNAVQIFLNNLESKKYKSKKIFCVGNSTKSLLEENNFTVENCFEDSSSLAEFISKNNKSEKFLFLCGKNRLKKIEEILSNNNVDLIIKELYETKLLYKKVNNIYDCILFYSPSGVESFIKNNFIEKSVCFCIGNTTAYSLKSLTNKIIIAKKPTVRQLIKQVNNFYKLNYD
tara:strand:+ start:89366 stop:90040 length:675 start_codon:yes stop_codon:yes gene_type:complete